jgi:hypothetical protein
MNEDRNQGRFPRQQEKTKHPPEWQQDLNPNHLSGQNIGQASDAQVQMEWNAFHLRKRGLDLGGVNDEELKQVPIVAEGERLQQGATYIDLQDNPRQEFTARGNMAAGPSNAFVPKDEVSYEIWNRLVGKPHAS